MKEYNLQTKKWEEPSKIPKAKARELCKRKRPHDFQLTIPDYRTNYIDHTPDEIKRYYELEQEEQDFNKRQAIEYEKIRVKNNRYFSSGHQYFECSVCGKKKYK